MMGTRLRMIPTLTKNPTYVILFMLYQHMNTDGLNVRLIVHIQLTIERISRYTHLYK